MTAPTITESGLIVLDLEPEEFMVKKAYKENLIITLEKLMDSGIDREKNEAKEPSLSTSYDGSKRLNRDGTIHFNNCSYANIYIYQTDKTQ